MVILKGQTYGLSLHKVIILPALDFLCSEVGRTYYMSFVQNLYIHKLT